MLGEHRRAVIDGYFEEGKKFLSGEKVRGAGGPDLAEDYWDECVELAEKFRREGFDYEIPAKP